MQQQLQKQILEQTQGVTSNQGNSGHRPNGSNDAIKRTKKIGSGPKKQLTANKSTYQASQNTNGIATGSTHNSNKQNPHYEPILSKILMPSSTADRLFKMIKTPIGNSRAKTPIGINTMGTDTNPILSTHQKSLNILNNIDQTNN